jgi:TonB family protein
MTPQALAFTIAPGNQQEDSAMSRLDRNRARTRAALTYPALLMLSAIGLAQAPPDGGPETQTREQVPIELFQEPRPKLLVAPNCNIQGRLAEHSGACEALFARTEGWVELAFMVDPHGKPFEISVIRSTGNKIFDAAAAKAVEQSTFEPATLDRNPIESGYELKYRFVNTDMRISPGASGAFVREYKALLSAINSGDRAAADAALSQLKIGNLYEDAYFGLATYNYWKKWGDESQQLEGLRRAIAEEDVAHYLPKDLFQSALLARMQLEMNAHQYAEVLTTWKRLQKSGVDKDRESRLRHVIDQLQKLRSDDSAYEVAGWMPEGRWFLHLFKRHFQAEVSEGFISQAKLRCDKRYVSFAFDPKLQYQVASAYGNCSVELEGAPGTRFKLVQF